VSSLMIQSQSHQWCASITSLVAVRMALDAGKLELCIIVCNKTLIFGECYVGSLYVLNTNCVLKCARF